MERPSVNLVTLVVSLCSEYVDCVVDRSAEVMRVNHKFASEINALVDCQNPRPMVWFRYRIRYRIPCTML